MSQSDSNETCLKPEFFLYYIMGKTLQMRRIDGNWAVVTVATKCFDISLSRLFLQNTKD